MIYKTDTKTKTEVSIGPLFAREDIQNFLGFDFHNEGEWLAFAQYFRMKYEDHAADLVWKVIRDAVIAWNDRTIN